MKRIFAKSDTLLIKSFLQGSHPTFIRALSLEMDVDYLAGLCTRFLKKDACLEHKLVDLDIEQKREIGEYLNKPDNIDDRIFYLKMKAAYLVLQKYYDKDGFYKD